MNERQLGVLADNILQCVSGDIGEDNCEYDETKRAIIQELIKAFKTEHVLVGTNEAEQK